MYVKSRIVVPQNSFSPFYNIIYFKAFGREGGGLSKKRGVYSGLYIHFIHFICVVLNIHWGLFANTY